MPKIYLVIHGDRRTSANPGLTVSGFKQVTQLRRFLPRTPSQVVCGTGRRHLDTARALNLAPTRLTGTAGVPEAKDRTKNTIILPDGSEFPYQLYTGPKDRKKAFLELVNNLPANSVVITSRGSIKWLGDGQLEGKKATAYRYDTTTKKITEVGTAASSSETDEI